MYDTDGCSAMHVTDYAFRLLYMLYLYSSPHMLEMRERIRLNGVQDLLLGLLQ
jgi:folylpolyglutamate synthase/dihydropteroate synthase